jgi:hypothetical protein
MQIGDKTLSEWQEFARRDDCLDRMVPSDLRLIVGKVAEAEKILRDFRALPVGGYGQLLGPGSVSDAADKFLGIED